MKLTAISMVKDEVDVIERTLRHLYAQGVDEILLLENASTDGTWELLRDLRDGEFTGRLGIEPDHEVGYFQSRKMTHLATLAHQRGADWIVPFDADELWTVKIGGESTGEENTLRGLLERWTEPDVGVRPFAITNHYRTALDPGGHPFDAMQWRDPTPLSLAKVAFRAWPGVIVEAGNHGVRGVPGKVRETAGLHVHHYPYRSVEQFIRKARNGSTAYAATDLPRSTGLHWREWGETLREHGEDGLRQWYLDAFTYGADPASEGLVFDPVRSPA